MQCLELHRLEKQLTGVIQWIHCTCKQDLQDICMNNTTKEFKLQRDLLQLAVHVPQAC